MWDILILQYDNAIMELSFFWARVQKFHKIFRLAQVILTSNTIEVNLSCEVMYESL